MQLIADYLHENPTDLPVRFIGIQEQGPGFSSLMFDNTTMTWLRETPGNTPSNTWSVPIPSRPSQEVYYRDAIILDHNNEFVDVQNLTSEPISSSQPNLDKFVASLLAAATTADADNNNLPDYWELDNPNPTTPPLIAYATGGVPAPFTISQDSARPFTFTFRNRIGRDTADFIYQLQASADGGKTWSFIPAHWSLVDAYTPYDGTGTRLSTFAYSPSSTPGPDILVRLYIGTN